MGLDRNACDGGNSVGQRCGVSSANALGPSRRQSAALTAVEDRALHVGKVLAEALVLVRNLERQLASVAKDEDPDVRLLSLELVEGSEHKDRRLTHARLGLADHIHAKHGLGNAFLLH